MLYIQLCLWNGTGYNTDDRLVSRPIKTIIRKVFVVRLSRIGVVYTFNMSFKIRFNKLYVS